MSKPCKSMANKQITNTDINNKTESKTADRNSIPCSIKQKHVNNDMDYKDDNKRKLLHKFRYNYEQRNNIISITQRIKGRPIEIKQYQNKIEFKIVGTKININPNEFTSIWIEDKNDKGNDRWFGKKILPETYIDNWIRIALGINKGKFICEIKDKKYGSKYCLMIKDDDIGLQIYFEWVLNNDKNNGTEFKYYTFTDIKWFSINVNINELPTKYHNLNIFDVQKYRQINPLKLKESDIKSMKFRNVRVNGKLKNLKDSTKQIIVDKVLKGFIQGSFCEYIKEIEKRTKFVKGIMVLIRYKRKYQSVFCGIENGKYCIHEIQNLNNACLEKCSISLNKIFDLNKNYINRYNNDNNNGNENDFNQYDTNYQNKNENNNNNYYRNDNNFSDINNESYYNQNTNNNINNHNFKVDYSNTIMQQPLQGSNNNNIHYTNNLCNSSIQTNMNESIFNPMLNNTSNNTGNLIYYICNGTVYYYLPLNLDLITYWQYNNYDAGNIYNSNSLVTPNICQYTTSYTSNNTYTSSIVTTPNTSNININNNSTQTPNQNNYSQILVSTSTNNIISFNNNVNNSISSSNTIDNILQKSELEKWKRKCKWQDSTSIPSEISSTINNNFNHNINNNNNNTNSSIPQTNAFPISIKTKKQSTSIHKNKIYECGSLLHKTTSNQNETIPHPPNHEYKELDRKIVTNNNNINNSFGINNTLSSNYTDNINNTVISPNKNYVKEFKVTLNVKDIKQADWDKVACGDEPKNSSNNIDNNVTITVKDETKNITHKSNEMNEIQSNLI